MALGDLVQANQANAGSIAFSGTPVAGNLLVAVGHNRDGGTLSASTGFTSWTEQVDVDWKPGDSTYRAAAIVLTKVSEGDETGTLTISGADYFSVFEVDAGSETLTFVEAGTDSTDAADEGSNVASISPATGSLAAGTKLMVAGVVQKNFTGAQDPWPNWTVGTDNWLSIDHGTNNQMDSSATTWLSSDAGVQTTTATPNGTGTGGASPRTIISYVMAFSYGGAATVALAATADAELTTSAAVSRSVALAATAAAELTASAAASAGAQLAATADAELTTTAAATRSMALAAAGSAELTANGVATRSVSLAATAATELTTAAQATRSTAIAATAVAELTTTAAATNGEAVALDEDFLGGSLPAGWTESDPLGVGTITYGASRATIAVPASTVDSISSTSSPDNSVGLTVDVPDHGGDIDIAVQVDTDISDQTGHAINLLLPGSGTDAARFAWFHNSDPATRFPSSFAYARASGSGASFGQAPILDYMTGVGSWLRVTYSASTGEWEALDSADGATWNSRVTGTRSFTPTKFKFGVSNAPASTAMSIRLNRVVDVLALGPTDLRAPAAPSVIRTPVSAIDGSSLPAGWVDDSIGTSTVATNGSALVFTHDATQDNDPSAPPTASARIRWTGDGFTQWGVLARITVPTGRPDCYLVIGAGLWGGAWLDQYGAGGGYVAEIQLATGRRAIRVDDPTDGNVAQTTWPTGLDEVPYCELNLLAGQPNLTGGAVRWFRVERVGKRIRMREWADGDTEPTTWGVIDAQDEVEDGVHFPYISLSHNDVGGGTAVVNLDELQYYSALGTDLAATAAAELTAAVTVSRSLAVTATASAELTVSGATTRSVALAATGSAELTTAAQTARSALVTATAQAELTTTGAATTAAVATPIVATATAELTTSAAATRSAGLAATASAELTTTLSAIRAVVILAAAAAELTARVAATRSPPTDLDLTGGLNVLLQPQTLTKVRPATGTDTYGNTTYAYGDTATRTDLIGWVQQDQRSESYASGRGPLEQQWLLICNDATLDALDRIEWDTGHPSGPMVFAVEGPPEPAYRGLGQGYHHSEATLRLLEG